MDGMPRTAVQRSLLAICFVLPALAILTCSGCALPRIIGSVQPALVAQIVVYDCRQLDEKHLATITDRTKIEAIVRLLNQYRFGWKPVTVPEASGRLRLAYLDAKNPSNPWPVTEYRFCANSVDISTQGKTYSHEISPADQQQLCQLLGLDESFFSTSPAK